MMDLSWFLVLVTYCLALVAARLLEVSGHVDISMEFHIVCRLPKKVNSWQQLRRG
jgi:hypothetical protein